MALQNPIEQALDELHQLFWLDGLWTQICTLYRHHGRPDMPKSEVGRRPIQLPLLRPFRVANLGQYQKDALDSYNSGVKAAYRCIGFVHVGLLLAVVDSGNASKAWTYYYTDASAALDEFFHTDSAWVEFENYVLEPARDYLTDPRQLPLHRLN